MSVIRKQYVTLTSATLPDVTLTTVDIVRPESTPGVPYAEGTDYVTTPRVTMEGEGGMVVVDLPAALENAAAFLRAVEIWQSYYPAQSGLGSALFPTGATPPSNGQPTLVRTVFTSNGANSLATNNADVPAILGGTVLAPNAPSLMLGAGQFVRLSIFNNSGGPLGPANIEARYDFGLNESQYRSM